MSRPRRMMAWVERHPVLSVLGFALAVRVLAATIVTIFFDGAVALDDVTYSQMAMQAAQGQTSHWDEYTHFLYSATATFLVPLTLVFKVFGPHVIAGQIFVGVLGAGAAAATTRLGREFLDVRWAIVAGAIVALLPSQIVWSSAVLKDPSVWLLLSVLALCVAVANRTPDRNLIWLGLGIATLLWLLAYLRLHTFVIACWALFLASLWGLKKARGWRIGGAAVIAVTVPWLIGAGPAGADFVANAGSLEQRRLANAVGANSAIVELVVPPAAAAPTPAGDGLERPVGASTGGAPAPGEGEGGPRASPEGVLDVAWGFEVGGEPVEQEAEVAPPPPPPAPAEDTGPLSPDLRHLPRGITVVLLEPVPGRGGSTQLRLASTEQILWYPVLVLAVTGLFRIRRHLAPLAFPVLAGGAVLVTYALTEGNIGTAYRHRGELVWAVALLAAAGARWVVEGRSRPQPEP